MTWQSKRSSGGLVGPGGGPVDTMEVRSDPVEVWSDPMEVRSDLIEVRKLVLFKSAMLFETLTKVEKN